MVVLRLPHYGAARHGLAVAECVRLSIGGGLAGHIAPTGLRTGPGLLTSRWPLARQMEARTAEI